MQRFLEKYLLPLAMFVGIVFYKQLGALSPATPYLLSVMLFISYCKINWRDIHLSQIHYVLLAIQYLGSITLYFALKPFGEILAQAAMICVFAPTATSAPVVVGLLGGSIGSAATFSLISNLSAALLTPFYFSLMGSNSDLTFFTSFLFILKKVVPILVLPFLLAIVLQKASPQIHNKVRSAQILSFYIWAIALTIVIASVIRFVMAQESSNYALEATIASVSLIICLLQFIIGRKIGSKYNRTVTGGQGLGQKNTILAIWLTQTYLNPLASLGPGLYVLWQNLINSYQIWIKRYKDGKTMEDIRQNKS